MKLLKPFLATAITLLILAYFLPTIGFLHWTTILIAAVILTLLDLIIKPILKLLFLPINIITFGLFAVVINVGLLWLATYLVPGFYISEMSLFGVELNYFFSLLFVSTILGFLQGLIGLVL